MKKKGYPKSINKLMEALVEIVNKEREYERQVFAKELLDWINKTTRQDRKDFPKSQQVKDTNNILRYTVGTKIKELAEKSTKGYKK